LSPDDAVAVNAVFPVLQYCGTWEALAARNTTTAMVNLDGQGQGVPRDPAAARAWTRRAADLGDSRAQLDLGLTYDRGDDVEQNL
jgi:TPR repeat protein